MRGDRDRGRNYHVVLSRLDNLTCLYEFGTICGYDIKHDLNAARFKTSILTYCDRENRGRIGVAAISNVETIASHSMHLQATIANMPCSNDDC